MSTGYRVRRDVAGQVMHLRPGTTSRVGRSGMSWRCVPAALRSRLVASAAERGLGTVPTTRGLSAAPGWSIRVIASSWLRGRLPGGLRTRVIARQSPFVSRSGRLHPLGGASPATPCDARQCPPEGRRIASFGVKMPPKARAVRVLHIEVDNETGITPPDNRRTVRRIGGARSTGRVTRSAGPVRSSSREIGAGGYLRTTGAASQVAECLLSRTEGRGAASGGPGCAGRNAAHAVAPHAPQSVPCR